MVPPDAFSMSSAHALVAGTSGWAGGSQIEILRSTGLSWASAAVPAAVRPIASPTASFFMALPPNCLLPQLYRPLTNAPTGFISAAQSISPSLAGMPHLEGVTHAVRRRVAREVIALRAGRDPARLNTPQWLGQSWAEVHGEAATRAIAAAHLIEAPLDLTPRADALLWAGRLEGELLPTGTIRRATGGAIADLPGFAEGAWWVQDAAATLPAHLLGDGAGPRRADR